MFENPSPDKSSKIVEETTLEPSVGDYPTETSKNARFHQKYLHWLKQLLKFRRSPSSGDSLSEQQDKIAEIGAYLRQTRQEKGLSLEAVAEQTCIPIRILTAIESGSLASLPEAIYIRGFIRRFADELGLDGNAIAHSFPLTEMANASRSPLSWRRIPTFQLRPVHLYCLYVVLVIVSVRGISHVLKQSIIEAQTWETPMEDPSLVKTPSQSGTQPIANTQSLPHQPVVVDIQVQEECWLKIVVDGKVEFEGTLPPNTHRTWTAKEQLTIRADNAGKVLVTLNDEQPKQLGQPGQAEEVTYQALPPS